jgi:hypothetical protein
MKRIALVICAIFAFALLACDTVEDANEKIEQCLEDQYGAEEVDDKLPAYEITCDEEDDGCQECVDCVMDEECDAILDGTCDEFCE